METKKGVYFDGHERPEVVKDRQEGFLPAIEELKRNVKMCKHKESEIDVQTYVEECMRLRTILEQTMI